MRDAISSSTHNLRMCSTNNSIATIIIDKIWLWLCWSWSNYYCNFSIISAHSGGWYFLRFRFIVQLIEERKGYQPTNKQGKLDVTMPCKSQAESTTLIKMLFLNTCRGDTVAQNPPMRLDTKIDTNPLSHMMTIIRTMELPTIRKHWWEPGEPNTVMPKTNSGEERWN